MTCEWFKSARFCIVNSTGMASGGMQYMQNHASLSVDGLVTDERVRLFAREWLFNRSTSRSLHLDSIECALAFYRAELHGRSGRLFRHYIIWELDGDRCFLGEFRCLYNQEFLMQDEIDSVLKLLDMPPISHSCS